MSSLTFLLCVLISIVIVVLALVRAGSMIKNPDPKTKPEKPAKYPNQGWKNWLLVISIMLFIAFWNLAAAFFFFVIVWLWRLNPKRELPLTLTDEDKFRSRVIYQWLLISSLLTIPFSTYLLFTLDANDYSAALAASIPLLLHFHLLFNLNKNLYLYRHTQQALILLVLRAALAAWAFSSESIAIFLLGNGSLWLLGSLWGFLQSKRGACWLMERKGEQIISFERERIDSPQMDKELEDMFKSLNVKDKLSAKAMALDAFRTQTSEKKRRAIEVLQKLGEVEKF